MTAIRRRRQLQDDVEEAAHHYFNEGGTSLELRFIDAVEAAIHHVAAYPASGSARYTDALGIPGLRFWPLKGFPYLLFYIEHEKQVDIWRLLHGQQDIPAWLRGGVQPGSDSTQ